MLLVLSARVDVAESELPPVEPPEPPELPEPPVTALLGSSAHPVTARFAIMRPHRRARNKALARLVEQKLVWTCASLRSAEKFRIYGAAELEPLPHKKRKMDLFNISFS
jgi:hypothetical protein